MNLILLYGPPAVGKLTVATELAKFTGYTLLHNHMLLNPIKSVFGFYHPTRKKLEREFRLRIVEEAVAANIDLIMTGMIVLENESKYMQLIEIVEKARGKCFLVQLVAPETVLLERVADEFRKIHQKVDSKERFYQFLKEYPQMYDKFTNREHLVIDTSDISPERAAKQIISRYKIQ